MSSTPHPLTDAQLTAATVPSHLVLALLRDDADAMGAYVGIALEHLDHQQILHAVAQELAAHTLGPDPSPEQVDAHVATILERVKHLTYGEQLEHVTATLAACVLVAAGSVASAEKSIQESLGKMITGTL